MRTMRKTSLALVVFGLLTSSGCAITRVQIGSPLRAEPAEWIEPEVTDMATVLDRFGAPNRILRHAQGDVFVYHFVRRNSDSLKLEEPIITNTEIFSYSVVKQREDRLVVLFDPEGIVESYGYLQGTAELD
jgi:hypothetical protein